MRIIDADQLVKDIENYPKLKIDLSSLLELVDKHTNDFPGMRPNRTAEWVEVTRCKDCIHRPIIDDPDATDGLGLRFPDFRCPCRCDDGYYSWMPNDNWFCGNGEKEEKTNE